jgi:hypothetical protein
VELNFHIAYLIVAIVPRIFGRVPLTHSRFASQGQECILYP